MITINEFYSVSFDNQNVIVTVKNEYIKDGQTRLSAGQQKYFGTLPQALQFVIHDSVKGSDCSSLQEYLDSMREIENRVNQAFEQQVSEVME